jgi:hypothetical protein
MGMKKGGKAHEDVAADKALIKKMVKPSARTGKAIGGAFGQFLSPALMLANAIRGDDKNRGGKATRKGRNEGGGANHEGVPIKKIPIGVSGLSPADAEKWKKQTDTSGMGWRAGYKPNDVNGEAKKRGGRTARKDGGGVFSGAGYPHKVPGVVPGGRTARASGGKAKGKGKGKTNINIVIAAGKQPGADAGLMPPGGMPKPPGGIPIPLGAQGGPPQGGAPMPMPVPMPMPAPAGGPPGMPPMARKSGGRISKIASSYKDMTAGSGGGEGRLQKTDIAKKGKDAPAFKKGGKVYSSYKDMDAGAGSGKGRLEKTEIASRKH